MPQLWVGRIRQDAADAAKYGCTGLMGIHSPLAYWPKRFGTGQSGVEPNGLDGEVRRPALWIGPAW